MTGLIVIGGLGAFAAALLRRLTGFGFAMAATPLLALAFAPADAVIIVILLQLALGVPSAIQFHGIVDYRLLGLLAIGGLVGAPFGLAFLLFAPANMLLFMIGVIVCLSAIVLALGVAPFGRSGSARGYLAIGVVSGMLSTSVAVPGPPVVLYLLAQDGLDREGRRSLLISTFTVLALIASIVAGARGLITTDLSLTALALIPAIWLGSWSGEAIYRRLPDRHLQIVSITVVVGAGTLCIFQALTAAPLS